MYSNNLTKIPESFPPDAAADSLYIAGIIPGSSVNGPGMRFCLFVQGCAHHCPGCQNPETHPRNLPQTRRSIADVCQMIQRHSSCSGLTISGGEPFDQSEALVMLLDELQDFIDKNGWDVWVWSGYTLDQIIADPSKAPLLDYVDVVVDGEFKKDLPTALWRGSDNQRLWQKDEDGQWVLLDV